MPQASRPPTRPPPSTMAAMSAGQLVVTKGTGPCAAMKAAEAGSGAPEAGADAAASPPAPGVLNVRNCGSCAFSSRRFKGTLRPGTSSLPSPPVASVQTTCTGGTLMLALGSLGTIWNRRVVWSWPSGRFSVAAGGAPVPSTTTISAAPAGRGTVMLTESGCTAVSVHTSGSPTRTGSGAHFISTTGGGPVAGLGGAVGACVGGAADAAGSGVAEAGASRTIRSASGLMRASPGCGSS
jgi:hypothetical protein